MKRHKLYEWLLISITTLAAVITVFLGESFLRLILTSLLVFILPGYALLAAWFPQRLASFHGGILFTLALSLAATALGGMVLNSTAWGLRAETWAIWLGGVTLISISIGLLRNVERSFGSIKIRVGLPSLVFIITAIILAFFALRIAQDGALNASRPGFTQLWAIPVEAGIHVGIQNAEQEAITYTLVVEIDDEITNSQQNIQLKVDDIWETTFAIPVDANEVVNVYLYRQDRPDVIYRSTHLTIEAMR